MNLSLLWHTDDYRGDHAADIAMALEYKAGETVEQLIERSGMKKYSDRIEIRLIRESELDQ